MNLRALAATSATVVLLALGGCGSSDLPSLDAGGDAKPATGATIAGDGYSFHVPTGWTEAKDKAGQAQVDSLAFAPQSGGNFRTNVNVLVRKKVVKGDLGADDYTKLEKGLVSELEKAGSTNVHVEPRLNLADETALHITGNGKQGDVEYLTNQYIAIREGTEYVVTFSFPVDFQQSQWIDITNPTMASWEWK